MATSMDQNETPKLSQVFEDGMKIQMDLEDSSDSSNSEKYQDNLQKAVDLLERATRMVNDLSLFSTNEELEEIPTSDIRYLLLPAILGDLTLRISGGDRLEVVQKGKTYFIDYLKRCRQYGVTTEEIPQDPPTDVPARVPGGGRPNLMAMQANREAKIRRYKQTKETEEKLKAIGSWSEIRKTDDDVQRNFYTLYLKKWVNSSLEQLGNIQQELEILQHMAAMKAPTSNAPIPSENQRQQQPTAQSRKPMKPFILTRDAVQAQVFGAGYPSIPTMSLDEFYQKEVREGKILPPSSNPKSERQQAEESELRKETEIETDDPQALAKARQWDDWKDDHKRGWGNRENMG